MLPYLDENDFTDQPELSRQQIGNRHLLNAVQTAATLYRINVLDSDGNRAAAKFRAGNAASVSH